MLYLTWLLNADGDGLQINRQPLILGSESTGPSASFASEFLALNGSNVMDPLAIALRISSHWHSGAFCFNRNFEIGIQSLYILKMWQFDYAFRYYQCGIRKMEVRNSSSRRKDLQRNVRCGFAYHKGYKEIRFRFVLAMNTFHSVHNVMLIITNVRFERFSHGSSEIRHYSVLLSQLPRLIGIRCTRRVWFSYQWLSPPGYASGYASGNFSKIFDFSEI
ncbi:hypothetical protein T08_2831 [Trichinella sp. T8]|nr:hypothetical protein T08_2831 [Trichinella sp. T8]